jgi:hypothetical protein
MLTDHKGYFIEGYKKVMGKPKISKNKCQKTS